MLSAFGRTVFITALCVGLVVAAAACGNDNEGDTSGASSNTVTIKPQTYQVRAQVTTTTTTIPTGPDAEGRWPGEQAYIVAEGEYPIIIAKRYDISVDELRGYNGWAEDFSDFPRAGATVRIPPGAKYIDPAATTTTTEDTEPETSDEPTEPSTETSVAPDPASCTPGTYVVEVNDNPTLIAARFDVTLEALTAANGWDVPEYKLFPRAGVTITIPPGAACTSTTAAG